MRTAKRIVFSTLLFLLSLDCLVQAESQWLLMSRHGECAEVASLKRKVSDLGDVRDPDAFVKLMQEKGLRVMINEISTPHGRAVEVRVPERDLALLFVTAAACQQASEGHSH